MIFKPTFLAAAIALSSMAPSVSQAQDSASLTPAQFYALGVNFMRDNRAVDAAKVADQLLERDPNDEAALILAAEAAIAMTDFSQGIVFARRAYFQSDDNSNKFAAARLAALANSQLRRDTRAQLWLRRAHQFSPNATTSGEVAEDYQFLRDRNPWSSSLRFAATPSSNINNGSANDKAALFDLPFFFSLDGEARALSGLEISAGGETSYRLAESTSAITFLSASADVRSYVLSETAQAQAPTAKGRDFSDANLSFGIQHRRIFREGARPTDFSLRIGRSWYAGDPYAQFASVSVGQSFDIDTKNRISVSLSGRQENSLTGGDPVTTASLNTRWMHSFESSDTLSMGIGVRRAKSDTADSDYLSTTLNANYNFADSFQGMQFGFGLNAEARDFDATRYKSGPREDKSLALSMSVTFQNWEFYGFRPVMNMQVKRNLSNVDLFDRDYSSLGFDLQSSF